MYSYETTSEAYVETLRDIYTNPDFKSAPRGQPIYEKTDYTFRVLKPDASPIVTRDSKRNEVIRDYTAKEVELYNSCTNLAEDFGKASKFWNTLANPDGTVNSAYGYLIWKNQSHGNDFEGTKEIIVDTINSWGIGIGTGKIQIPIRRSPWQWAKESLIADKDTRQAVLRFSLPEHFWVGNKDMTCTLHGNFLIRDNKLHLSMVLRSNDWNKGILYDLPFFCSLMDKMLEELRPYYPTLNKGHYTHTAHSAHIYEKDEKIILSMLGM